MKDALARLEALERGQPGDLLPLPDVYAYMRLHGQGVLLIDDLPELPKPKRGRKPKHEQ